MNVLIVEDERVAARRLERLTREVLEDRAQEITRLETLKEALEFLENNSIDLLLLDLNLNGLDGFDILKDAVAESFQTVIVSANTDRAIEAYEYGVLDFIPKPFEKKRLMKAFERLEGERDSGGSNTNVLVIKNRGRLSMIDINDVHYIKGAGDYSEINLKNGEMRLHSKSLESLMKILPNSYRRIHKSYIVDLNLISDLHIHGGGRYECELDDGIKLPVSRTRYRDLLADLEKDSMGKEK